MELNVTVGRSVLATKSDLSVRGARLPHEPDFLAHFPPFDHLEATLQELKGAVRGPRSTPGRRPSF
jgi:hypothetical protein